MEGGDNLTTKNKRNVDTKKTEEGLELEKKFYKMDFSKLAKNVITDLDASGNTSILFDNFPKKRVMDALQNPQSNVEELRNISNFLYILSPHYRRLCNYHSEMPTLDWYIAPHKLDVTKVKIDQFRKAYDETLFSLENMRIKHEIMKVLQVVFREGIFYGYEYATEDSYMIQKLDPDNCRISSQEDGVYNFAFNFQYFDGNEDVLENYAPEFQTKYKAYQNSTSRGGGARDRGKQQEDLTWQELDSAFTICIKTDESINYPFPPFIGVFPEVYELEDYKALKKSNTEMQNYAIVSGTIPMNDKSDTANDFKVTLDTAVQFGNKIVRELPDQVGFILSVFDDMQVFRLSDDKVGSDKVEEAVSSFWNASGVGKSLFTDGGSTDAAIRASLITDEQSLFTLLRQVERWLNRKLTLNGKTYKFAITMLDTTWQNKKEKVSEELKASQFGIPNKIKLAATMGITQSSVSTMSFLENDVLQLHENWVPLQSSHTQSGEASQKQEPVTTEPNAPTEGDAGRPSEDEEETRTDDTGIEEGE